MHDGVTSYELLRYLHVFLFVFWLGPDVAVYAWSRKAAEAGASPEQRVVAGQMVTLVESIPRAAISLMLTVGGLQTYQVFPDHPLPDYVLRQTIFHLIAIAAVVRDIRVLRLVSAISLKGVPA